MESEKTLAKLPPPKSITCKADAGASSNYIAQKDENALRNIELVQNGPKVKLPNNEEIQASKKGLLPLPTTLSTTARTAHVFKGLTNSSLVTIG